MIYRVNVDGREYSVEIKRSPPDANVWVGEVSGKEFELNAIQVTEGVLSILIGGRTYEIKRDSTASGNRLYLNGRAFQCEVRDPRALRGRRLAGGYAEGPKRITAPMPGKVIRVVAAAGTPVEAGQGVIVIEAMKMQNELKSPKKGRVQKIVASEGAAVNAGDTLAVIE
jgi:biotin carboxyl carrier protein